MKKRKSGGNPGTIKRPARARSAATARKVASNGDKRRPGKRAAPKAKAASARAKSAQREPQPHGNRRGPTARSDAQGREIQAARLLAAIVDSSDAAIIGKTSDGIVTSWNRSAERIFGYAASEMIGKSIEKITPAHRQKEMRRILAKIRKGESIASFETERRRKDGGIVPVSLTVSPIHDETGRIVGASKILHDLTNQKTTEAQLAETAAQLAVYTQALTLAPAMVRTMDGKILFWGKGLKALYGWSRSEALGKIAREILATEYPESRADIHGQLLATDQWHGQLVCRHRDGRRIAVASQWALHRDASGAPVSVLQVDRDITEAKQAQFMIEEREAVLRSVLETAPDAVITIDQRGIMQSFSLAAETLFGYAAGEAIGHNVNMLMSSPHHELHDGYLERYLRTGEKRIIGIGRRVEARRKDGTIFPMELAVGEVNHGGTRLFTGFIRDLTARTRIEQELRQAQKMEAIGQLTGGVAHDFNNLLTAISGNLEMLERRIQAADDREMLAEAMEAVELGAQLSNRLLAFGRRQSLDPKPIVLSSLVVAMLGLLRRTLGATVEIDTRLADDLPAIVADPGQFENALLNLAINARDAMPEGGRLLIETGLVELDADYVGTHVEVMPGRYAMLSVTDTGIGMTPEVQERAFEPFFTTKQAGSGSGLGLSMIYGFVKQSGGHIQLYSEIGRGTTIRIYLPAREQAGMAETEQAASSPTDTGTGEVVLVVEDDAMVRRVTVRRLQELGYTVIDAGSASAALEVIDRGEPVDLLFTDIVMPGGMTGIDLAHEVRHRRPTLKILFTSGYAESVMRSRDALKTNAAWLSKPYSAKALKGKLRELLDS